MSIGEGISRQSQQEVEEPPAREYVQSEIVHAHLRWRVGRCRCLAAAAALIAAAVAMALMGCSWSVWTAVILLVGAGAAAASALLKKPPLRKERGQAFAMDEDTSRDLAVQYGQWKRLGDWMLGLGVVLFANGLLLLILLSSYESKLPALLGAIQLGAGLFLCLSNWGIILAYHWLLPRGKR